MTTLFSLEALPALADHDFGQWEKRSATFCTPGHVDARRAAVLFLYSHNGDPWPLDSCDAATGEFRSQGRRFRAVDGGIGMGGQRWEIQEFVVDLPPLSGGSDAAISEVGCHADSYDAVADLFHDEDDLLASESCPCWTDPAHVASGTYCEGCEPSGLIGAFDLPADFSPSDEGYRACFAGLSRADAPGGPTRDEWLKGFDELVSERAEDDGPTILAIVAAHPGIIPYALYELAEGRGLPMGRTLEAEMRLARLGELSTKGGVVNLAGESAKRLARGFECGRTAALDAGHEVEAPDGYDAVERAGFALGVAEAGEIVQAREMAYREDQEMTAAEMDRYAGIRD